MLDSFLIADAIIGKSETLENFKKDGVEPQDITLTYKNKM